jgi:hypothetical protein
MDVLKRMEVRVLIFLASLVPTSFLLSLMVGRKLIELKISTLDIRW